MKAFEEKDIERVRDDIDEALQFIHEHRVLEARRKLNHALNLLLEGKELPNPDLEPDKDVSISGGNNAVDTSPKDSIGAKKPEV
jgi:hypothetical protein